jgi:hypothetical protein
MHKLRLTVLVAVVLAGSVVAGTATAARPSTGSVALPIVTVDPTGTFEGVLEITEFIVQEGQVLAVGTLTGTLTDAEGAVTDIVVDVVLPLITVQGTCQILHLELGPLDLDLLGVVVHLDQVVLDISATAGPGKLLGNLLCTVAHLLDSNALPQAIVNLLNIILGLLG